MKDKYIHDGHFSYSNKKGISGKNCMYLVMDYVSFTKLRFLTIIGFKKIKRSSFCLSLTVAGIQGSEYLEDREDFLNVFFKIVCKSFMGALSFLNFEVNGNKNFRPTGFVNIFWFCP